MSSAAIAPEDVNPVHPELYVKHGYPHDFWTRLRAEDPVHWFEQSNGIPFWAITKHADIVTIGKSPDKFVNGPRLTISHEPEQPMDEFPPTLIQLDPPKHGKYRDLVSKRFTPRFFGRMHGDIERIAKEIPGEPPRDFVVAEESEAGLPAFVNCIGIESPGLTAAPAIAERVVELLSGL